ncbi:MAG TPA: helix-turn-helix transcriptional regulator [Aggregatilineales bacterium]|nr:helix-turn-helix transcriptional regulator [Aggregatilineales bacterium]
MLTGKELRSQRRAHGMTLDQLSKVTGIDERVMADYENGTAPITTPDEAKLRQAWRRSGEDARPAKAPRKARAPKTPPLTQWLQTVADSERTAKTPPREAENPASVLAQATAPIVNEKQRRLALSNLLKEAQARLDDVFAEDKQTRVLANSIEELQPAHRQLVIGVIDQLEHIVPSAPSTSRLPPQEQILQTLSGPSAYHSVLNYLQAAVQLLMQAEIVEQTPLMMRLQKLSEFDRNTVQLLAKRYQDMHASKDANRSQDA